MLAGFVGFTPTNGSTSASGKFTPAPIGGHAAYGSPAEMSSGGAAVYGPADADPASASSNTAPAVETTGHNGMLRIRRVPFPRLPRHRGTSRTLLPVGIERQGPS